MHDSRAHPPRRRDRDRAQTPRASPQRRGGATTPRRRVHPRGPRLGPVRSRGFGWSGHGLSQRGHGERPCQQRGIFQHPSRQSRLAQPSDASPRTSIGRTSFSVSSINNPTDSTEAGSGCARRALDESNMGLLVSPEEALHPGARRRDARAEATGPVRDHRGRLEQRHVALTEMPCRRQRPCTREQQLNPLLRPRGVREEPESAAEPSRSGLGCKPSCCLASLAQEFDRIEVSLTR